MKFEICSFIFSSHFYFHCYLCTIFFLLLQIHIKNYCTCMGMYAFSVILLILYWGNISTFLVTFISFAPNVSNFICTLFAHCWALQLLFLHTCFKDRSSLHIFIYKFWPRFKIVYRLARTFKTQMTSKIFKFGDLGDSSMNKFVWQLQTFKF